MKREREREVSSKSPQVNRNHLIAYYYGLYISMESGHAEYILKSN